MGERETGQPPVQEIEGSAPRSPGRGLSLAIALVSLLGVGLSVELTRIHWLTHTDPEFVSVCAVNDNINCETVAQSPYSVLLGVPISVWGLLAYCWFAASIWWSRVRHRPHPGWPLGFLLLGLTCAVAFSVYLAVVSLLWIESLCLFCCALYLVNLALLVLVIALVRRRGAGPVALLGSDLCALRRQPALSGCVVWPWAVMAGLLLSFYPSTWHPLGWEDLAVLTRGELPDGGHWLGAGSPRVVIEEYTDYECPHCRRAHRQLRKLAGKYPHQVRLVHRHFPLDTACNSSLQRPFHRRACEFSRFVECAGRQGRYWEANDAIFAAQEGLRAEAVDLGAIAVRLGLNRSALRECLAAGDSLKPILQDLASGQRLNIRGTPTFVVDGRLYVGRLPEGEIERLLLSAGSGSNGG